MEKQKDYNWSKKETTNMFIWTFLSALVLFLFKLTTWALILALPLGIAYYFYLKHRSTYFQRIGLPHPPVSSLFLGNLADFEKNLKSHHKIIEWNEKYGPTFGMLEGGQPTIVTSDPEILNEVFVKQYYTFQSRKFHPSFAIDQKNNSMINVFFAQGNQWKRLRALFAGSLATGKIKSADPIIKRAAEELIEVLQKHENQVFDVSPDILNFTFAVISRSTLGIDEEFGKSTYLNRVIELLMIGETIKNYASMFFVATYEFLPITKYLWIFSQIIGAQNFKVNDEVASKISKALDKRDRETPEETKNRHQDFLDFLREATVDDLDLENKPDLDPKVPKKMNRTELIQQARAFLIAGADTTATLLNYSLYELAKHPECEELIMQEINDFIKSEDDIVYNTVKDLTYLDRFVKEVLRFHPLAYTVTARRAIQPITLKCSDGSLLHVDKGVAVMANSFAVQMDEKIWGEDAKKFNPDRFLPENSEHRHPMAWLPFGAGPRICPGKNLALHEAKAVLIFLLRKFKFEICDETDATITTHTITNFETLKMKIVPRL